MLKLYKAHQPLELRSVSDETCKQLPFVAGVVLMIQYVVIFLVAEVRQNAHCLNLLLDVFELFQAALVAANFAFGVFYLDLVSKRR